MFEDYYKMYSMEQSWFRKTHKKILNYIVIYQITITYSCEQDIHLSLIKYLNYSFIFFILPKKKKNCA